MRVNTPCNTDTAGVMLLRIPNRFRHLRRETFYDLDGIASKAARNLISRLCISLRWCSLVSSSHPRTVLSVNHAASPRTSLLVDMDPFQRPYIVVFHRKTVSMPQNRWRSICRWSTGPP